MFINQKLSGGPNFTFWWGKNFKILKSWLLADSLYSVPFPKFDLNVLYCKCVQGSSSAKCYILRPSFFIHRQTIFRVKVFCLHGSLVSFLASCGNCCRVVVRAVPELVSCNWATESQSSFGWVRRALTADSHFYEQESLTIAYGTISCI